MEITDSEDKIKVAQLLIGFAKGIADRCRLDKAFSNAFNNCFETELTMSFFEKMVTRMAVIFTDNMDEQIEALDKYKNEIKEEMTFLELEKEWLKDNNEDE